jgi:hypothetical protein
MCVSFESVNFLGKAGDYRKLSGLGKPLVAILSTFTLNKTLPQFQISGL